MYKILVAEDEMIERKALCKTLTRHLGGLCTLCEAKNGREALTLALAERPQVAILDIQMPGLTGLEAARQMRGAGLETVVLFLTAFDNFDYARQAVTVRAVDYLLKPYDETELILSVESAMQLANKVQRFAALSEQAADTLPTASPGEETGRFAPIREKVQTYISANYHRDISMQDAAQAMNYSDAYFCRLFKECFQVNFSAYLNSYRVEKAKQMLAEGRKGVREISTACGYADANYFTRVFKRIEGVTPSEYRLQFQGGQ